MKKLLIILIALLAVQLDAQDLTHYKKVVKELSSAKYQGRGYAKGGANKAGVDWSMREYSPAVHGQFLVYHLDTLNFDPERIFADLAKPEFANCMVTCEYMFSYNHKEVFSRLQSKEECPTVAGFLYTWTSPIKFYKAYGDHVVDKPIVWVTPEAVEGVKNVKLDVDNEFLKDYGLFNVIAKVEGVRHDSCYVFTAHYDHLGNLGKKVYYPGANDNASGTAAIVTLAAYYAQNRPEYDMYFVAFSGEDANLRGSEFFANNPLFPLDRIKYLFNIDMIGDNNPVQYCEVSDEGMRGFALFERINGEKHYFRALNRGELAANSDHYPFATRHVPCIFLENQEGDAFPYYHTPNDNMKTFRSDSYAPAFRLITDFIARY